MSARIKVGISAWTDKSLVASKWYPPGASTPEARLRYYASQFPLAENDSTYYALPAPHTAELWVERTPESFTMNVKAFATLTEHYTDPKRLPEGLQMLLPPEVREKQRVYRRDLGEPFVAEIAAHFLEAIEPLRAAGKLGLVLMQYPVWFTCSRENRERLVQTCRQLAPCRVAVEFRNATWMSARNQERTLSMLHDNALVYTCVDEPQGFPSSVPPVAEATTDLALVRFHGRSASTWMRSTVSASERFRYRYSEPELRAWVPKIERLADHTREVHVVMNNCYRDFAVVNARQMTDLLAEHDAQSLHGSAHAGA